MPAAKVPACAGAEEAAVVAGTLVVDVVVVEVVELVAGGATIDAGVVESGADELGTDAVGPDASERLAVWVVPLHPASVKSGSDIETAVRSQ
jgi:hypothetical protein